MNAPARTAQSHNASTITGSQIWFVGRIVGAIVVALSATALLTEVQTTEMTRLPGLLEASYHALTLFVLGAAGVPAEGTGAAGGVLWVLYFVAPVISASFLVTGLMRLRSLLKTPERVARGSSGHVIVCGYGNHGRLALEQLVGGETPRYKSAVVVDRDLAQAPFVGTGGKGKPLIPVLRESLAADIRATLERAGLSTASALVAATGNDMLNVAICLTASATSESERSSDKQPKLLALVGDYSLAEHLTTKSVTKNFRVLNTYRKAAERLLSDHASLFAKGESSLVIIGFGRFGQALAHEALGQPMIKRLIVVDKVADEKVELFKGGADRTLAEKIKPFQCDAEHPDSLRKAVTLKAEGSSVLVAVCTDNDASNLRLGFKLQEQVEGATLLTRTFDEQAKMVSGLMGDKNVCFAMHGLLANVIPKELVKEVETPSR